MTNLPDTLAALDVPGHLADAMRDVFLRYGKTVLSFEDSERMADAAFSAYRTGQLVPVPSVERVMEVVADYQMSVGLPHNDAWEDAEGIATAVIAAMKDGKP